MTGTAINPLFRAAYLGKHDGLDVTLVLPWLSWSDQVLAYPDENFRFDSHETQAWYVRKWVEKRIGSGTSFRIIFYEAEFSKETGMIHPVEDITKCIERKYADIAVVEEPQHLLQKKQGHKIKETFKQVIGIIHTDYSTPRFPMSGNTWVTQCHKIIVLPGATQNLKRSVVCNVNGVDPIFLEVGKRKLSQLQSGENAFPKGAYYIGNGNMRSKEYRKFLCLLSKIQRELFHLQVDLYVCGNEDYNEVCEAAQRLSLGINVYPGCDHSNRLFHDYKVFINPSTTICGTTAEALAMGKTILCHNRPSNKFFKDFLNCCTYDNDEELVQLTLNALSQQPHPLNYMQDELTWEAATTRFAVAAGIRPLSDQITPFTQSANIQRYNKQSWKTPTNRFI
ncbi:unnamed protein product [Urochloa humidicola]